MSDFNASDTRHLRAAKKAAKAAEAERAGVVVNLMSSPAGRSYVYDWLARCHVFHTPFTGSRETTDFNCGQQSVGLNLLDEITRSAPEQYIAMLREAATRNEIDGRRYDNGGRSGDQPDPDGGIGGRVDSDYDPIDRDDASAEG